LAIIVLTLNKFLWLKFEVFTGSPIHPPPLGALTSSKRQRRQGLQRKVWGSA
jgi:hypothetical protein